MTEQTRGPGEWPLPEETPEEVESRDLCGHGDDPDEDCDGCYG